MGIQDNILEQLNNLGLNPPQEPEPQTPAPQPGLNDQGFGAVAMPPSSASPVPRGHRLQDIYAPLVPRQDMQAQVNPLTGGLDAVPMGGMSPGQMDPWKAEQVQKIEQAMDVIRQKTGTEYLPQHADAALRRYQRNLQQLDPQGLYRKGGMFRQMSNMDKFMAQNVHIDKEHGFAIALDGKGTPHFHKLETPGQADYHQKLLDIREQQHKELMAHRDAQLQEMKSLHQMTLDRQKHEFDTRMQNFQTAHDQMSKVEEANRKHAMNVMKHVEARLMKPTEVSGPSESGKLIKKMPTLNREELMKQAREIMPDIDKYIGGDAIVPKAPGDLTGGAMGAAHAALGANGAAQGPRSDLLNALKEGFGE